MKISAIGPSAFKLSHQGLVLVSVMLLFELLFIGALYAMLDQVEVEAKREEHAKQVVAKATQLIKVIYEAGDFAEKYALTQDPEMKVKYQAARKETVEIVPWLQANLHDRDELEGIKRLEQTTLPAMRMTDYVVHLIDQGQLLKAAAFVHKKQQELQPMIKQLVPDLERLLDTQKRIELETPVLQQAARDRAKQCLLAGVVLNIIGALLLSLFIFRRITLKLAVLNDNAQRLGAGRELNPVMGGSDEISVLDRVFHQIAEVLKQEEEALRNNEAKVRSIIERMPVGLIILGDNGAIEFSNPTVEKMFGYSPRQLINRSLSDLVSPPETLEAIVTRSDGKVVELQGVKRDKAQFPVELSVSPITLFVGERRLATLFDITERSEIQKLRQAFVAMVSHELRTPLSSVRGYLTLLSVGAYGELAEEAKVGADRAEHNVVRLIALINDLLDLEKMESGNLNLEPCDTSSAHIIDQSVEAVKHFADEHKVAIERSEVECPLHADPGRIVQVLVNLLSNAVKYSETGSTVRVEVAKHNSEEIEFRVIDKGRGIPDKFKDAIFERFQQVENADTRVRGGTGLGLAICKVIVEAHNGTIGVESEPGRGSTFWFRLPLEQHTADH